MLGQRQFCEFKNFEIFGRCLGMFINSLVDEPAEFGVQIWIFLDLGLGSASACFDGTHLQA